MDSAIRRAQKRIRLFGCGLLLAAVSAAQQPAVSNSATMPPSLQGVAIDQRLGEQLPLDVAVRDEAGREVQLREYFASRPVILALVYYECPMLCTLELNGLLKSIRVLPLELGRDFEIITLSFDPGETPALAEEKKKTYVRQYGREGAGGGWHFLTAEQETIDQLTEAVGFRYRYDPETDLYSHASGIMVLTPQGKLSRYFYGIEYSPRDLRLGLVEASANRIGSLVDQVLLFCFHYDPVQGQYSLVVLNLIRAAGIVTVVLIAGFLWINLRRERRRRPVLLDG